MASEKEQGLQKQLAALRKLYDVEVLNNRIRNYGQEALEAKRAKNAARYKKAKAAQNEAQSKLNEYQEKANNLISQIQIEQKLVKTLSELEKVTRDRNFYIESGEDVPKDIEDKYNQLTGTKANLENSVAGLGNRPLGVQTPTAKPTPTSTPTPTPTPTPSKTTGEKPGKVTGEKPGKTPTDAEQREEALGIAAGADFALPETIFNNVPSLKRILERYVQEDWTPDKLRKAIRDDVWFRKNSAEIKARYVQFYNYQDLVKSGQAQGTTDYEKQIATLERQLADKARAMGSSLASDPTALRRAAENMYITNVGIDDAMTLDFIAAAIKPIGSIIGGKPATGYSGEALKNYQQLQSIAKRNGFKLVDIVPGAQTEQQVLQGLATGRIDINRIAQDARKLAAQGQPQYVRDLLGQGYDLQDIYAPYRTAMAKTLEINDDQIDLNDPTLRMAITDKGDMNLYDFSRILRKDNRWQYTANAKEEVANATLQVLRDFGFQG